MKLQTWDEQVKEARKVELPSASDKDEDDEILDVLRRIAVATERTANSVMAIEWVLLLPLILVAGVIVVTGLLFLLSR